MKENSPRKREELLQKIVDHIPVMLAFFDAEGNFQWINREWEKVLGWSLEEVKTRDILAELYPDPIYRQFVIDYIQSARETWGDFRTQLRDGTFLDTSWTNIRLSDGTNIGIGQDISQRKKLEAILKESELKYRLIFESNPHPLWVYDVESLAFVEVNEAAIQHYGYSREQFLSMTIADIRPPEDIESLREWVEKVKSDLTYKRQ